MITRQQYLSDSTNLHESYYKQFVNSSIKQMVLNKFGIEKLKKHYAAKFGDKNYIDLNHWDSLAGGYSSQLCASKLKEVGDYPSLAGAVCILKTAARMIVEEDSAKNS